MYTVAIIGGIGSGKSTVTEYLGGKGAHVISLDRISHDLLADDRDLKSELVDAFGAEILDADDAIDSAHLAAAAFASEEAADLLNSIMHPRIIEVTMDIVGRMQGTCMPSSATPPVLVIEVPLPDKASTILEMVDEVICVCAQLAIRVERVLERGLARTDLENRLALQVPQSVLMERADRLFENSGSREDLMRQIDEWWDERAAAQWKTETTR